MKSKSPRKTAAKKPAKSKPAKGATPRAAKPAAGKAKKGTAAPRKAAPKREELKAAPKASKPAARPSKVASGTVKGAALPAPKTVAAPKATGRTRSPAVLAQRRKSAQPFRDRLVERQRELMKDYSVSKDDSQSHLDNGTEDYIDYAVNSYTREFLLSLTELDRKQLLLVEEALKRIDLGEYGHCMQCAEAIHPKRLEVVPWVRYCVRCQALEEQGLLPAPPYHPVGEIDDAAVTEDGLEDDLDDDADAAEDAEDEEEGIVDEEPIVVDADDSEE